MNREQDLLAFIKKSPSAFHAVAEGKRILKEAGFEELKWGEAWKLVPGGQYYSGIFDSTLIAFRIGKKPNGLKIVTAHTDCPGFRIKPQAGVMRDGYGMLNIEPYGGMILSTWFDRPLSVAGKVVLRGKDAFSPKMKLVNIDRPLFTIPSLAIHMNRQVNDGVKINRQTEMMPLVKMLAKTGKNEAFFEKLLVSELGLKKDKLLAYDLTVYPYEAGCLFGADDELISSPRLDDLTSVKACIDAIVAKRNRTGINLIALFDNEEIGSRTKQGAASALLLQMIAAVYRGLGLDESVMQSDISNGFMLSADVAHALHPNYEGKADPTNRPVLNGGVALKQAAAQTYAGDAEAIAVIKELCRQNDIPWQYYLNRSDIPGGSTIGALASAVLSMRTMDIGVPILAMHSARETMGAKDQTAITNLLKAFFA